MIFLMVGLDGEKVVSDGLNSGDIVITNSQHLLLGDNIAGNLDSILRFVENVGLHIPNISTFLYKLKMKVSNKDLLDETFVSEIEIYGDMINKLLLDLDNKKPFVLDQDVIIKIGEFTQLLSAMKKDLLEYMNTRLLYKKNGSIDVLSTKESLLRKIVFSINSNILASKAIGKIFIEGGEISDRLDNEKRNNISLIELGEINVIGEFERTLLNSNEIFKIVLLEIRGVKYTALEVPKSFREMPLRDMCLGFRLWEGNNNIDKIGLPNIDLFSRFNDRWIIVSKNSISEQDGKVLNGLSLDQYIEMMSSSGVVNMSIEQMIIISEIIKRGLGQQYLDFCLSDADFDGKNSVGIRKMIGDIQKYLEIDFMESLFDNQFGNERYLIRNIGVYVDENGRELAYLRGSDSGIVGGVMTLGLGWSSDIKRWKSGVRTSIAYYGSSQK